MNILVRLPNWLGDMVMSLGFINALKQTYPAAAISVIAKKGIDGLLEFFPPLAHRFIYSREEYQGTAGVWRFGRMIRKTDRFDLFFSLPDSFSSALMGFASGAKQRIGYRKEFRSFLLTKNYQRQKDCHRVEDYVGLLQQYTGATILPGQVVFDMPTPAKIGDIIVNINSEATSRRLPLQKAVSLLGVLRDKLRGNLVLIGGKNDANFVEQVIAGLSNNQGIVNLAGRTSLQQLVNLVGSAQVVLTTDSGPAHLANAAGTPTVVLFGAGNENHTAPYNEVNRSIIRLGQLPCEPCVKNTCVLYGTPKCLELLDEHQIVEAVRRRMRVADDQWSMGDA